MPRTARLVTRVTPDADAGRPPRLFRRDRVPADRHSRRSRAGHDLRSRARSRPALHRGQDRHQRRCATTVLGFPSATRSASVGNASGEPMHDVARQAARRRRLEVMNWLHRSTPSAAPSPPAELVRPSSSSGVEPPRREWFAEHRARRAPARERRPAHRGTRRRTIVALDPDIPRDRQRAARGRGRDTGVRWRVDDVDLGPASGLTLWSPGAHARWRSSMTVLERSQPRP
jgi:hypothetical protein